MLANLQNLSPLHTFNVQSGAAENGCGKFACKVRMCEISHIRTSHTCDMRSCAAKNGYGCLGFGIMRENLVARCECAKFRTFAPRTRVTCDRVRPKMVADA